MLMMQTKEDNIRVRFADTLLEKKEKQEKTMREKGEKD